MHSILFLGSADTGTTTYHRSQALVRLGHRVDLKDPFDAVKKNLNGKIANAFHYRTGYTFLQTKMKKWLTELGNKKYDLIWVDSGELFGLQCVKQLKEKWRCPVVLFNVDDPTGGRDGARFKSLRKALPAYDLVTVVRTETEAECRQAGANVLKVIRSYDEVAHHPFAEPLDIMERFRSDVAFIGTWMPNEKRDEFMLTLVKKGVPLSIWGDGWPRSPHFSTLQNHWRGKAVYNRDYVAAVQGAKVCVGLLSKGNRDLHTQRSLEIPFIGGVFCAERTTEHLAMYSDGNDAVFWNDADECAAVCKALLADDERRERIRIAGMKRVREMGVGNEDICKIVLDTVGINTYAKKAVGF